MLYGEKMKEICEVLGISRSELPDGLYSTLLNAISENAGVGGSDTVSFVVTAKVGE